MMYLTFTMAMLVPMASGQEPAQAQPKTDPAAVKLFADARAARAAWQNFPGFKADLEVNVDGKIHRGDVDVSAKGKVKVHLADEAVGDQVQRELASLVAHRLPASAGEGEGEQPSCYFLDKLDHPLGKAIAMSGDDLHSSFRIRDRQILEVNRTMKDARFTISVLENTWNQEKQYLPVSFVVNTWDTKTKQLRSSVSYHHTWQRIGSFDLPQAVTIVNASAGSQECRSIKLTNHKLP
jgi:hypothetical protein